jgi:outer membrane protein OmpA-like peptidoglycan-associated protein
VDDSENELVIDASPPSSPTVNSYSSEYPSPLLSGTFPEDDAFTMAVSFDGERVALGGSEQLSSDGKGNWSLVTSKKMKPGQYDVKVVVADKAGNERSDTTINEIEILARGQALPAAPAAADKLVSAEQCQTLLDKELALEQIEFSPGKAGILAKNAGLLSKLTNIIKQCGNLKIEIGGHTDWQRSASYNQALSERRANTVRDTLLARGVRADNIAAVGYGESQPIADNSTRKGRAANRRTEFRVLNRGD